MPTLHIRVRGAQMLKSVIGDIIAEMYLQTYCLTSGTSLYDFAFDLVLGCPFQIRTKQLSTGGDWLYPVRLHVQKWKLNS